MLKSSGTFKEIFALAITSLDRVAAIMMENFEWAVKESFFASDSIKMELMEIAERHLSETNAKIKGDLQKAADFTLTHPNELQERLLPRMDEAKERALDDISNSIDFAMHTRQRELSKSFLGAAWAWIKKAVSIMWGAA